MAEFYVCPFCAAVSHNQNDVAQRYCGACHRFSEGNGNIYSLGGEFLVLEENRETGVASIRFDEKGLGRSCGSCSLCCKLLPIGREDEMGFLKVANQRCRHQRTNSAGCCKIHAERPFPCRSWSCRWMSDPKATGLPRPDRCHYVVDSVLDHVTVEMAGKPHQQSVLQVWVDPDFPDAHRDPRLRAYLHMMAEKFRCAALIRYDERAAFLLAAPPITDDGKWHEARSNVQTVEADHPYRQAGRTRPVVVLESGEEITAVNLPNR
jgi:hypothetical protein